MIIYQCDMMEYNADLVFQCPQSFGVPFPSHFTNVSLPCRHNPFRLIGVGLLVWTIATAGCGCSFDFWSITICRM
jgi:hypothetical protein